jgi:hypothetical protein
MASFFRNYEIPKYKTINCRYSNYGIGEGFNMNKVEKMGVHGDISSLVNKYLDKSESKVSSFASEITFNKYDEKASASREFAVMKLKNGQKINLDENSILYETVLNHVKSNFLRINSERFINPSEIAEFIDIDTSIDYAMKDVVKETEEYDENWKNVFYPDGEEF